MLEEMRRRKSKKIWTIARGDAARRRRQYRDSRKLVRGFGSVGSVVKDLEIPEGLSFFAGPFLGQDFILGQKFAR